MHFEQQERVIKRGPYNQQTAIDYGQGPPTGISAIRRMGMFETLLATLFNIRTVEEMSWPSEMKKIAGECWKSWCGRMARSGTPILSEDAIVSAPARQRRTR
ncbi:hypothetical protein [Rhizobium sp. CB3060]|uniref:hypothetical protein n=1 Tax=Rhizobium sp. CB3060 TaxID=3138255 RepID=UPI004053FDCF